MGNIRHTLQLLAAFVPHFLLSTLAWGATLRRRVDATTRELQAAKEKLLFSPPRIG